MKRAAILFLLMASSAMGAAAGLRSAPVLPADSVPTAQTAVTCARRTINGARYRVCEIPQSMVPRLQLLARRTPGGAPLETIEGVNSLLRARGERLLFATNSGLYHTTTRATGMLVADGGHMYSPLNQNQGPADPCSVASFYCPPNGVFYVSNGQAGVLSTADFARLASTSPQLATQSGPMLVGNGVLARAFIPGNNSTRVRNGVGVRADGTVVFAISDDPVNFYHFATAFRDELDCENAVFLDGYISRLYSVPGSAIPQQVGPFAAMFVVSEPASTTH
jgi:uncharacterized protein YigE (DUF2233 family)